MATAPIEDKSMRRDDDQRPARRPLDPGRGGTNPPRRFVKLATRVSATFLMLAARGIAGDGPELTPPAEMPLGSKPAATSTTPARPAAVAPGGRAVLALPGLTTPSARPPTTTLSSPPALESIPGELTLDAPIEMRPVPSSTRPNATLAPGRSPRPIVLESTPGGEPLPIDGPATRSNPSLKRSTPPRIDPQPTPSPARRSRLFGFLAVPAPTPSAGPNSSTTRAPLSGRALAEDPREESAQESALKRRIERQALEAAGDRARSIEVRLVGKNATVQAHGVKFYQKRGVRKSLEAIPALSGLRSTIEVVD
jgi:hypothetical protein